MRVEGDDLGWLKGRLPPDSGGSRARHLILLTDRGLLRALMLAGGAKAVRFRDWAETVLLREIRGTGTAIARPGKAGEVSLAHIIRAWIVNGTREEFTVREIQQVFGLDDAAIPRIEAALRELGCTAIVFTRWQSPDGLFTRIPRSPFYPR